MGLLKLNSFALFAILAGACSQAGFLGDNPNIDKSEDGNPKTESLTSDESADPPVNVTGTYLVCDFIKEASNTDPNADLGCVVKAKDTQQKIRLADVATSWDWIPEISDADKRDVLIDVDDKRDADPAWHAIFHFRGTDASVVNQVARLTKVVVPMVKKGETQETTVFSGSVEDAIGMEDENGNVILNENPDADFSQDFPVTDPSQQLK